MSFEYAKSTAAAGLAALGIMAGPGCQAVDNYTEGFEQQEQQVQETEEDYDEGFVRETRSRNLKEELYGHTSFKQWFGRIDAMDNLREGNADLERVENPEDYDWIKGEDYDWVVESLGMKIAYKIGEDGYISETESQGTGYMGVENVVGDQEDVEEARNLLDEVNLDDDNYIGRDEVRLFERKVLREAVLEFYDQNK